MELDAGILKDKSWEVGALYGDVLVRDAEEPKGENRDNEEIVGAPFSKVKDINVFIDASDGFKTNLLPIHMPEQGGAFSRSFIARPERDSTRVNVGILGFGALSFAGVEVLTSSIPYGLGAAVAALALTKGSSAARHKFKYNSALRRDYNALEAMKEKSHQTEAGITLSNKSVPLILNKTDMDVFSAETIQVYGNESTLTVGDVLNWLEKMFKGQGNVRFDTSYNDDEVSIRVNGAVVVCNRSLYDLYRSRDDSAAHSLFGIDSYSERQARDMRTFNKATGSFEQKYKAIFEIAESPDARVKMDKKQFETGWKDATISIVNIPAGLLIKTLLALDHNPSEFWNIVSPDAQQLADNYTNRKKLSDIYTSIKDRYWAAGGYADGDETELAEISQEANELNQQYTRTLIAIAGLAMLRDRTFRYDAVRQSLITSVNETAHASDQYSAIRLFDIGIAALVQALEPDSEEAIETSKSLQKYLTRAAPFMDGREAVFRQFYDGMRKQFPQLELAEFKSELTS